MRDCEKSCVALDFSAVIPEYDDKIFNFGGSYTLPFADQGQIWLTRVHPQSTLTDQISSVSVYCVAVDRQKTQILLHFQIQHSVVAPPSGEETKLNAGA